MRSCHRKIWSVCETRRNGLLLSNGHSLGRHSDMVLSEKNENGGDHHGQMSYTERLTFTSGPHESSRAAAIVAVKPIFAGSTVQARTASAIVKIYIKKQSNDSCTGLDQSHSPVSHAFPAQPGEQAQVYSPFR